MLGKASRPAPDFWVELAKAGRQEVDDQCLATTGRHDADQVQPVEQSID